MTNHDRHEEHAARVVLAVFGWQYNRAAVIEIIAALLYLVLSLLLRFVAVMAVLGVYLKISGPDFLATVGSVPLPAQAAGFLAAVLLFDAVMFGAAMVRTVRGLLRIRARRAAMTQDERDADARETARAVRERTATRLPITNRIRSTTWWAHTTVMVVYVAAFGWLTALEHDPGTGLASALTVGLAYFGADEWSLRRQYRTSRIGAFTDPYPPRHTPEI